MTFAAVVPCRPLIGRAGRAVACKQPVGIELLLAASCCTVFVSVGLRMGWLVLVMMLIEFLCS